MTIKRVRLSELSNTPSDFILNNDLLTHEERKKIINKYTNSGPTLILSDDDLEKLNQKLIKASKKKENL